MASLRTRAGVLLALEQRTAYRFSILATQQARCLAGMYSEEFGLSVNGWKVLSVIGHHAPLSATDAGGRTSLELDKVTRAVNELVKRRFVIRRQDPADRRRVVLSLSVRGKEVLDRIEHVRFAIEVAFLGVLTSRQLASLYTILDKLEQRARTIFTGKNAWRTLTAQADADEAAGTAAAMSRPLARARQPARPKRPIPAEPRHDPDRLRKRSAG